MAAPSINQAVMVRARPEDIRPSLLRLAGVDGYQLLGQTERGLALRRRRIPVWAIVLAVFTFPFGLLFLLAKRDEILGISLDRVSGGTQVTAAGRASPALQHALHYVLSGPDLAGVPVQELRPPPPPPPPLRSRTTTTTTTAPAPAPVARGDTPPSGYPVPPPAPAPTAVASAPRAPEFPAGTSVGRIPSHISSEFTPRPHFAGGGGAFPGGGFPGGGAPGGLMSASGAPGGLIGGGGAWVPAPLGGPPGGMPPPIAHVAGGAPGGGLPGGGVPGGLGPIDLPEVPRLDPTPPSP